MKPFRRAFDLAACLFLAGVARSQETQRISLNASGGELDSDSTSPVISADGNCVAFTTAAAAVTGDANGLVDVYVRDRAAGTIERVSVGAGGAEANGRSWSPGCSADGRFVVFTSEAENLVPGDLNGTVDVFVRDRLLGTTERVSVASDGTEGDAPCLNGSISADGRWVSFLSDADNLVAGDTKGSPTCSSTTGRPARRRASASPRTGRRRTTPASAPRSRATGGTSPS